MLATILHRIPAAVPRPLRVASAVVLIEGVLIAVYGLVDAINANPDRLELGVILGIFFIGYGIALGCCAWGLLQLRRGARGPVMISQLVMLGLAWNSSRAGAWPLTVAMLVPAVIVLVGMLMPASIAALEHEDEPHA